MRAILVATLLAASLGLAGTSGAFAAPANGLRVRLRMHFSGLFA